VITFLVNSEKPRDAAMRNTGTGFVVLSHHSLFDDEDGLQRGKVAGGHVMTGEALKKLQQQMKVNRDERRLTVSPMCN